MANDERPAWAEDLLKDVRGVNAAVVRIEGQLKAPKEAPTLRSVIDHCQDGSCSAHAEEWEGVKTKIVQEAYGQIPDDVLRAEGLKRNMIPSKIVVEGVTA